jgi:orotidine-5'-phosphate decarboxylase
MNPRERLIFPLDVGSAAEARQWVELLQAEVGLFKVGLELFMAAGPQFLAYMADAAPGGYFLDLKFHDIPATVRGALQQVGRGVRLTTVHADQSRLQLQAMVAGLGSGVKVLGVTVLTSLTPADLMAAGIAPEYALEPVKLVLLRARLAREAGCHGVVCGGTEARAVKQAFGPEFLVVCPGIRPDWAAVPGDDQQRVLTPSEAIRAGADYIVVGRPIRLAPDPVAATRRIVAEIARGAG